MAAILMTCQNTGATVAAGQHATKAEFEAVAARGGRFRCTYCHQVHSWKRADAVLANWPGATSTR